MLDAQLEQDVMEIILSLCGEHEWPLSAAPAPSTARYAHLSARVEHLFASASCPEVRLVAHIVAPAHAC